MSLLVAILLSQVSLTDESGPPKVVRNLNCVGAGITCSATSTYGTITVPGGGSVPSACSAGQAVTSNGTALVCTGTLTASDVVCAGTCVADAEIAAVSGAKVSGSVATASALSSNPAACGANLFVTDAAADGTLTCTQPTFSNLSGSASIGQGGTTETASTEDAVLVGASTTDWQPKVVPDCDDSAGQHLNYDQGTNAFSCGSTSSGAPSDAEYWTGAAHASLSAEKNLGALATGLVINTAGVPSIKGSNTCTNQFPRSDNASGTWTCASVADADLSSNYSGVGTCTNQFVRTLNDNAAPTCASVVSADMNITTTSCTNQFVTAISSGGVGTCTTATLASAQYANQGSTTTVLHGNAAGNPSWGAVVSADMNITTTSCTNQFVTAISSGGVGTCTTDTLASAQHANQGTTVTVLHGNAAGNPSWAAVSLANDVTGVLGVTSGGTGSAPGADDQLLVSDSTSGATWRSVPNCTDTGGQHLNYTAASNTFSCGTSGGSTSPLTTKGDIYTFTTVDARKAVGADGLCLKANSAEATGLEWASCSAGGGLSYAEVAAAVMGGF